MNERISDDDPQLTAYALGELESTERAVFEQRLATDAAARARVDEIRAAAAFLEAALESEPMALPRVATAGGARAARRPRAPLIRFPQFYYVVSGLAAACFAVAFVVSQSEEAKNAAIPSKTVVRHRANPTGVSQPEHAIAIQPAHATDLRERFFATAESTTSSFPLHVGTGSYSEVREALKNAQKPRKEQVQVAEMINAFNYSWPKPAEGQAFSTILEAAPAPWARENRLLRVGLKGHGDAKGVVARNAHVRVEFNAERVKAWRLLGFERNGVATVSANAGGDTLHGDAVVTALYEVKPSSVSEFAADGSWVTLSLKYIDVQSGLERELAAGLSRSAETFEEASQDFRFIASVAAFGFALKDAPVEQQLSSGQILRIASGATRGRPEREEFVGLVNSARGMLQ